MANIQQLFAKAKRWNIVASNYDIDVLLDNCYQTLFRSSLYITHCVHHLLPDKHDHTHATTLRPRGHNYSLPRFKFLNARNSFINRSLYKYVYRIYSHISREILGKIICKSLGIDLYQGQVIKQKKQCLSMSKTTTMPSIHA